MRLTRKKQKHIFPIILCLILVAHMAAFFAKIGPFEARRKTVKRPLVVKLKTDSAPKFKKQIVESEDSESKEVKDDAFLSDTNRSFDRQTRARKNDVFNQGRPSGGKPSKGQKSLSLSDLGAAPGENPLKELAEEYSKNKKGLDPNASPNSKVSSTNDYLEDVPLGDMTNLNTVEYKYFGFYHRIKQKLEQFWGRSLYDKAEQLAQNGRRMPSSEELITSLQVTLNHSGEVVSVKVVGTSGIKELDDAAIESFNQAGPFPNPPKGLIRNGKVVIEWGFVVKS